MLLASGNYFDMLGIGPALGRTFTMRDEIPGIATVAVISDALWRRGFGGDPQILGRKLRIDEDVYEIIGVMPPTFRHPTQTLETDIEVWAPTGWKEAPFTRPSLQRALHAGGDRPGDAGHVDRRRARPCREPRAPSWRANTPTSIPIASGGRRGFIRSPPISSPPCGRRCWC